GAARAARPGAGGRRGGGGAAGAGGAPAAGGGGRAAARRSAGAASVVMTMVLPLGGESASSGLARSRSSARVTTAIGAEGVRPSRNQAQRSPSDSGRTGP